MKTQIQAEVATDITKLATDITNKRGYSQRWQFSVRKCDQLLAKGLPHLKLSARQIRISIPEADQWMREQFQTSRRAASKSVPRPA
jgi:hypothetical protein